METLQFDYFRGAQAEQYAFYRIPKILFTGEQFRDLSCEAKILYGLMLDRMSLSLKNHWLDEENRVYIVFTVEEIMELMGCGRNKAIKSIAELDTEKGIGLIEKKRLGMGKPNIIYVKNFMEIENEKREKELENAEKPQKFEKQTSRSLENKLQEVYHSDSRSLKNKLQEVLNSNCNKTNNNNTDYNNNQSYQSNYGLEKNTSGVDGIDEIESPQLTLETYRRIIQDNIDYACYQENEKQEVDELIALIAEVMVMPQDTSVRIAGENKPVAVVKNQFMKITHAHIEYVLFCMHKNTRKVGNIKAYLLTALYNAPMTINNYYQAEVNHDFYGDN